MQLAERLAQLRQEQGISLSEVARRAQVSKAYVSQLEHGDSKQPSYEILARIAIALGTSVSKLTGQPAVWEPGEASVPASLQAFAEKAELPEADVSMLSKIHFRGKRPKNPDDWAHIYETIRRTIA
jgi:transcriptional regulator with XRE-family HTH domain